MSIEHLPKPANVLPLDITIALRMAVAHRFDAAGAWTKPAATSTRSTRGSATASLKAAS